MEALEIWKLCALGALTGVTTHLLYFIRGEHDKYAHRWITGFLTSMTSLAVVCFYHTWHAIHLGILLTTLLSLSFFAGLYGSIATYRMVFHPLRRFPGPFWAPLSNLWHVYMIRRCDNYFWIKRLHEQYGPIVRTGKSLTALHFCPANDIQGQTTYLSMTPRRSRLC